MSARTLRQRLADPAERAPAKAELRRRILEIVNRKFRLTDIELWRESAPDYLPWNPMLQEIKALDKDKKLRLEILKPGHLVIHSLETPPIAADTATEASSKAKPSTSTKRSGKTTKKTQA
jgi:hypothetical protein